MSFTIKTNNGADTSKNRLTVWFFTFAAMWTVGVSLVWVITRSTPDTNKFETYQVSGFGTLVSSDNNMFTYLYVIMPDGEKTSVYCNDLRTLYSDEEIILKPSDTLYVSKSTLTGQPFDHTTRSVNTCLITERHVVKYTDE